MPRKQSCCRDEAALALSSAVSVSHTKCCPKSADFVHCGSLVTRIMRLLTIVTGIIRCCGLACAAVTREVVFVLGGHNRTVMNCLGVHTRMTKLNLGCK